jgi:hypothetical protein
LLSSTAEADGSDVISESYSPAAEDHNIENIGLEPVWPYSIIGDASPLFALAKRTFMHRPNLSAVDWSFDPIDAARLGLGSEVASTLVATTQRFQGFVNGMAKWEPTAKEFYVEQTGVVADALQEALVQDYDGVIRIAPAIPPGWDFEGSVYARGKTKVNVQMRNGVVTAVVIEAGRDRQIKLRNPWPGNPVDVISTKTGKTVAAGVTGGVIEFSVAAGEAYIVENHGRAGAPERRFTVSGTPATGARKLGPVQIGLFAEGH